MIKIPVSSILAPVICHETEDFAVVFKPPRMHCAPLRRDGKGDNSETLLGWYAKIYPPVMELSGKEGGLLHRLDFETQGLVLFAKTQQALENLSGQQKQGKFIKEYSAICQKCEPQPGAVEVSIDQSPPLVIESYFRPYGPGRKQVRPVTKEKLKGKETAKDAGAYYKTEITGIERTQDDNKEELYHFTVRLRRGFRHQIRCHLAWVGFPVLNDPLYGNTYDIKYGKTYDKGDEDAFLALRATGLFFDDPKSGKPLTVRNEK